jgi:hypothetical protein
MQSYKPGSPIALSFQLEDDAGAAILPSSYDWSILDEAGTVLQGPTTVAVPDPAALNGVLTLTVPSSLTTLAAGLTRAIRTIEVLLTAGSIVHSMTNSAMVRAGTSLVLGVNTTQTYMQAVLLAEDLGKKSLAGWVAQSEVCDRESALIEAYDRLCKLNLRFDARDSQSMVIAWESYPVRLNDWTAQQLLNLDEQMLRGLRLAQLVEASEILQEDEVALARESGLISTTVGESSQFFRSSKPIDRTVMPISTAAMVHIQRWVRTRVSIGRT